MTNRDRSIIDLSEETMTHMTNAAGRTERSRARRTTLRGWLFAGLALASTSLAGCSELLDVENPNQLVQEDLESPAAAGALANGAQATVARAYGQIALLASSVSDELKFTGSRDAWVQLTAGDLRDPSNEFSDAAWPFITEGRWMADEAVKLLKGHQADGNLTRPILLAESQLYSAIIYTQIADLWEDFVKSNRTEEGAPLGEAGVLGMYDEAVTNLTEALSIAEAAGNTNLRAAILAQRARARYAKALRSKITPAGQTPANPLVSDAGANADALAALALVGIDWDYRFTYSANTVDNNWGANVNERLELRPSDEYVTPTADDKKVAAISLLDPIDGVPSPALSTIILDAVTARQFNYQIVVSARELRLILAESALAGGDEAGFTTQINLMRAGEGLSDYAGQIPALDMLKHMRKTHLYNTGRRLLDHYRFGTKSSLWNPNFEAANRPGTLFPIAQIERISNCYIIGSC